MNKTCKGCWGSGRITCGGCGGSGSKYISQWDPFKKSSSYKYQPCISCGGSGKRICGSCGGSGKIV
jgi:DnaJ-class molecular chaperone